MRKKITIYSFISLVLLLICSLPVLLGYIQYNHAKYIFYISIVAICIGEIVLMYNEARKNLDERELKQRKKIYIILLISGFLFAFLLKNLL